jgi:GLPGLI family protein
MMKRLFFLFLLACNYTHTNAQSYVVTYEPLNLDSGYKKMPFTINREGAYYFQPKFSIKLLFNDTIGFSTVSDNDKSLIKMFEKAGKKRIANHIQFSMLKGDRVYKTSFWPSVKKNFFVLDTLWTEHWKEDTASYTLLNYPCMMAYAVSSAGDTSFVYYTNELPGSFGPLTMWGRTGAMLGTYQQKWGRGYVATSIEKIDYEIKLPADKLIVTRKEYELLKNQ